MLKEDLSKEVQKRLGLSDELFTSFSEAFKSEEESDITLPQMHVFTVEEFTDFKNNQKVHKKPAWIEESMKEAKEENGWKFSGKDYNSLYEYAKDEGLKEGQKKPDERFNELKSKYDVALNDVDSYKNQVENLNGQMFINDSQSKLVREVKFETSIKPEQIFTLYTTNYTPSNDEGVLRVKRNGSDDYIMDNRYNKLKATDHFLQFAEDFKMKDTIKKPDNKNFDPKNPIFTTKQDYEKWVNEDKPDDKLRGEVWLKSLQDNPSIANT